MDLDRIAVRCRLVKTYPLRDEKGVVIGCYVLDPTNPRNIYILDTLAKDQIGDFLAPGWGLWCGPRRGLVASIFLSADLGRIGT